MNFRQKPSPIIDMNAIAKKLSLPSDTGPEAYTQPKHRTENKVEQTIQTVDEFKALPTTEIDDVINAAEQELLALKKEAQDIRDDYIRKVEDLKRNLKRIMAGCVLAHETMNELRKQVVALDNPVIAAVSPEIRTIEDTTAAKIAERTGGWGAETTKEVGQ